MSQLRCPEPRQREHAAGLPRGRCARVKWENLERDKDMLLGGRARDQCSPGHLGETGLCIFSGTVSRTALIFAFRINKYQKG